MERAGITWSELCSTAKRFWQPKPRNCLDRGVFVFLCSPSDIHSTYSVLVLLTKVEVADRVLIVELEPELTKARLSGPVARPPRGGHGVIVTVLPPSPRQTSEHFIEALEF